MAEREGAQEVLALLPKATTKAVSRIGAEAVISALDAEDCDGTGWGSLKRLQQFARGELYRQLTKKQERGYACGVLQVLGFSLEDINKGRTRPTLAMA